MRSDVLRWSESLINIYEEIQQNKLILRAWWCHNDKLENDCLDKKKINHQRLDRSDGSNKIGWYLLAMTEMQAFSLPVRVVAVTHWQPTRKSRPPSDKMSRLVTKHVWSCSCGKFFSSDALEFEIRTLTIPSSLETNVRATHAQTKRVSNFCFSSQLFLDWMYIVTKKEVIYLRIWGLAFMSNGMNNESPILVKKSIDDSR